MLKQIWNKTVLWGAAKLFAIFIAITVGIRGRRMSHNKGVAFKGTVRITDNPKFPPNDFFVSGKEFPCRMRFASISFEDSEMPQVRGVSIKFADHHFKSPFDMQMNTGRISLFWSTANFFFFASKRKAKHGIQYTGYYDALPEAQKAAADGMRVLPESFSKLYYYSQTPTLFFDKNGKKYYCTYRLTPGDLGPESGIDEPYLKQFWGNCRVLGTGHETRNRADFDGRPPFMEPKEKGRNFLEDEMGERLKREKKIVLQFQIQLREPTDHDDPEIFNSAKFWDHDEFPFTQLATVELTEQLSYEENQKCAFSSANYPPSLGNIPAKSIYDYNSLVYMRAHDELAIKTRLLSYKFFGVPKQIVNHGPRNRMSNEYE